MPYLDKYNSPLTSKQAAHLLRRATFGPTPEEITQFTGITAEEAAERLIANVSAVATPPALVVMDRGDPLAGQTFLEKPFDYARRFDYSYYLKYWWVGLMAMQNDKPSLLEKLTAFWQNHFVTTHKVVEDYRYMHRYLMLLRNKGLGNFKQLTIEMTKDPAMLIYQNGDENEKDHPNENYGRELQELFVVGQRNQAGEPNYTESDVKEAARVLTGWRALNRFVDKSTSIGSTFQSERHDTGDKKFSASYGNKVIRGRSGNQAGDEELSELIDMLVAHPESPKFICRKLYRWYVNTNVPEDIENNVIVPLANFFASPANNFEIAPVLKKLLSSDIFFNENNIGSLVKSPAELTVGALRFFNQVIPNPKTEYMAFRNCIQPHYWEMVSMQLNFLDQPVVFGSLPYYQTGYSLNWINSSTIGMRRKFTDSLLSNWEYSPGFKFGIDFLSWLRKVQPNFSDVNGTPALTCEEVFNEMTKHLFATELFPEQREFLIDKVMMRTSPRSTWTYEFNAHRGNPAGTAQWNVLGRLQPVMKYMLSMAEFQVF
jgi:uncharacterized protein (DUF1800 family)